MQNFNFSILGCGWLGLPLGEALGKNGFEVNGSTTTPNKIPALKDIGIEPFLISLSASKVEGNIEDFLNGSEILIIDIPPKLRSQNENFVGKIEALIPFIERSTIKKVLFVSSISVYADDNAIVTENSTPIPETESGKQLLIAEKLLQQNPNFNTTILRFGGLIGGDRNPVKFLAGKENLENPNAPVNLIHRNDCIAIIQRIIETESWNETFNAASPEHPTREHYYTAKAESLQFTPPVFDHSKKSIGKTIDPAKIIETLGYTFTEPL